jgi:UDP-2,3-diacylglucosamine hydrolase
LRPTLPPPALAATTDRVVLAQPVFISDLHLSAAQPRTRARFLRFLSETAPAFRELVILGDLFEFWIGDDELHDADGELGRTVAAALNALSAGGTRVLVMHGNRDLLLGAGFAQAAGAELLADPARADIGGMPTLLAHGDVYCTRDAEYQQFRAQVRDPQWQRGFLSQSLETRRAFVGAARARSVAHKKETPLEIMDVTPAEIDNALRTARVTRMIHGHTHRPATHRFIVDGAAAERWVLPDWDYDTDAPRGGLIRADGGRLVAEPLAP